MRKGTALALAGTVAASLVAGIALLGGRVSTASASASAPAEPQVITEHRRVTIYKTETLPPETIYVTNEDEQGEDEGSEVAVASATPTPSPTVAASPVDPGTGSIGDSHDGIGGTPDLGDGIGGGHDD